jgi:hypothetical protein
MMIDEKLNSIGVKLSDPVPSVGSFIPVVITGNLAFVSGQLPIEPGLNPIQVKYKGKLGRDIQMIIGDYWKAHQKFLQQKFGSKSDYDVPIFCLMHCLKSSSFIISKEPIFLISSFL